MILVGTAGCTKGGWTPTGQRAFNAKFLRVLHNFALTHTWRKPPGLALAVVNVGSHHYLAGAGFTQTLTFGNPIHDTPPARLELWTRDLNVPELIEDMQLLYGGLGPRPAYGQKPLQGPIGPLKFTFDQPAAAEPSSTTIDIPF